MNVSKIFRTFNTPSNFNKQIRHVTTTTDYCIDSLRKYDFENFMCTLFLPDESRIIALALRSFNVEVSRIADQTKDTKIGLMRMQFWEDVINSCYSKNSKKIAQHPVAMELYRAINSTKLTKRHFLNLINSRREKLPSTNFDTLESMEKYSEMSVSSVYYLILEGSGIHSLQADHAASHLGKAQGIVQLLRNTGISKMLNCISLPQDLLSKYKISHEDIFRTVGSSGLTDCTYEVACRAKQHLDKSRSLMKQVPEEGRKVLLPAIPVDNYLLRLQRVNYDVLHPSLNVRSWTWLPKLWYKSFRNIY